jgi:hypothetical protein
MGELRTHAISREVHASLVSETSAAPPIKVLIAKMNDEDARFDASRQNVAHRGKIFPKQRELPLGDLPSSPD